MNAINTHAVYAQKSCAPGMESGDVTSLSSSFVYTPGGSIRGGNITQPFRPVRTAFQADVPLGSLWNVEPDLAGPII